MANFGYLCIESPYLILSLTLKITGTRPFRHIKGLSGVCGIWLKKNSMDISFHSSNPNTRPKSRSVGCQWLGKS